MNSLKSLMTGTALAVLALPLPASAQGMLNVYCSNQVEACQGAALAFEKATGIKVNMTQKGSGEVLAQIRAEKDNPKGDIWYAGTGDPHMIAAEDGLTEEYTSNRLSELHPWAQNQWANSKKRSIGIYSGALGFSYNTEILKKKNLAAPMCWADLIKPAYKGEIQMPNPNASGTAYTMVATLVQLMGEDKAFDFMKSLHANVNAYTRSGAAPVKAAARGETGIALTFMHDGATEKNAGFPIEMSAPCEGTGYEVGSMSVIKGGRNRAQAHLFYEWALTPDAQRIYFDIGKLMQQPGSKAAPLPPNAPDLSRIKLINYDFAKYGSSAERRRLLAKWDAEIGALPR
jgi:iron(III) transport system substrate-binding protein